MSVEFTGRETPEEAMAKVEDAIVGPWLSFLERRLNLIVFTYGGWFNVIACPVCGNYMTEGKPCDQCMLTAGMVKCPNTHGKGESYCVLCRATPGFVEELK